MALPRRAARLLIGVGVAALVMSGCGSDDEVVVDAPVDVEDLAPEEADAPFDAENEAAADEDAVEDRDGGEAGDDWVPITDDSGIQFALPVAVEPYENTDTVEDGSEVRLRNYAAVVGEGIEVGFNVLETDGARYDLEAGVEGVIDTMGGDLVSSEETEVNGHAARDVEMTYGDDRVILFQLIRTDEYVLQPLAWGPASDREAVEEAHKQLLDSLEVY